jgi:hypothetical protein
MEKLDAGNRHFRLSEQGETLHSVEKGKSSKEEELSPIPYPLYDRVLEGFVHRICAFLLPLLCIIVCATTLHVAFYLAGVDDAKALIPTAHIYNKGISSPYPDGTHSEFNEKAIFMCFASGLVGLVAGLPALMWAWICFWVPRESILKKGYYAINRPVNAIVR